MVAKFPAFVYNKILPCGTVAKWKSDGLQNRYAPVRFWPVPPLTIVIIDFNVHTQLLVTLGCAAQHNVLAAVFGTHRIKHLC